MATRSSCPIRALKRSSSVVIPIGLLSGYYVDSGAAELSGSAAESPMTTTLVSCSCGKVECEATGTPIVAVVCFCDDCQRGSRQIETLPNAGPVLGTDGGTAYVLYRKDRFECAQGRELLRDLRLEEKSPTRRVVAGCCNSPMYLDFEKGHWVCAYRARFQGAVPPIQMHVQTRFKPHPDRVPGDISSYRTFPPLFFAKLLFARIAMLFS
jgi:hypothetical protein